MEIPVEILSSDPKAILDSVERYTLIVNPALVGPEATSWSVELNDDPEFFDDWQDADVVVKSAEIAPANFAKITFQTGERVPVTFIANILWWVVGDKIDIIKTVKVHGRKVTITQRAIKAAVKRTQK